MDWWGNVSDSLQAAPEDQASPIEAYALLLQLETGDDKVRFLNLRMDREMSHKEDQALVELGEQLLAEASAPDAAPNLQFRARLIQHTSAFEAVGERERERKRLERLGRVDKLSDVDTDEYWEELQAATIHDSVWGHQDATYNVHRATRPPPPPSQATLSYE